MRAQEIIRAVLDILDQADTPDEQPVDQSIEQPPEDNRFAHIFAMLSKNKEEEILTNRPHEVVADIEAVTTDAGGGVNGPKHPHDMRGNSLSLYPNQQEV